MARNAQAMRIICGDFNGEPGTFDELGILTAHEGWVDIGANGSRYHGIDNAPTCQAPGAKKMTREHRAARM